MKVLTAATRAGALAIAQTRIVTDALKKICPDIEIKIKKITTSGDRDRQTALWNLETSGFFTSQVEDALLAGRADFAVHSFKDLPTHQRQGLTVTAVCDRRFAEDCLLSAGSVDSIRQLPRSARIGTSSLRRAAQLKYLRSDLKPTPLRGNVPTRIKKLGSGEVDAVILARAGVERLGLAGKISFSFNPEQFIPAPAQGALAVQTRADDVELNKLLAAVDDKKARMITLAERQILITMQCGCHAPVGAFAKIIDSDIEIHAFIADVDGSNLIKHRITGPAEKALLLAEQVARDILASGGKQILESLEK